MKPWFTIEQLDEDSYIISEYGIGRKPTATCSTAHGGAC